MKAASSSNLEGRWCMPWRMKQPKESSTKVAVLTQVCVGSSRKPWGLKTVCRQQLLRATCTLSYQKRSGMSGSPYCAWQCCSTARVKSPWSWRTWVGWQPTFSLKNLRRPMCWSSSQGSLRTELFMRPTQLMGCAFMAATMAAKSTGRQSTWSCWKMRTNWWGILAMRWRMFSANPQCSFLSSMAMRGSDWYFSLRRCLNCWQWWRAAGETMPLLYLLVGSGVSLTPSQMMRMGAACREGCWRMLEMARSITSVAGLFRIGLVVIMIARSPSTPSVAPSISKRNHNNHPSRRIKLKLICAQIRSQAFPSKQCQHTHPEGSRPHIRANAQCDKMSKVGGWLELPRGEQFINIISGMEHKQGREEQIDDPGVFLSLDSPADPEEHDRDHDPRSDSPSNDEDYLPDPVEEEEKAHDDPELYDPESLNFPPEEEEKSQTLLPELADRPQQPVRAAEEKEGKAGPKKRRKNRKKVVDSQEEDYSGEYIGRKKSKGRETKKPGKRSETGRSRGKPRGRGAHARLPEVKKEFVYPEEPEKAAQRRRPEAVGGAGGYVMAPFSSSWRVAEELQQDWDSENASIWSESVNRRAECAAEIMSLVEGKPENIISLIANLPPLLYTTFH